MIKNQSYTDAFRAGMHAACNAMSRVQMRIVTEAMPVREADAFLAGYYAELRKLNADAETRDEDKAADRGDWEFHRDHDQ